MGFIKEKINEHNSKLTYCNQEDYIDFHDYILSFIFYVIILPTLLIIFAIKVHSVGPYILAKIYAAISAIIHVYFIKD